MPKKNDMYGFEFETMDKKQCTFVRFIPPHFLLSWEISKDSGVIHEKICRGVKFSEVDVETLKDLNVWKNLSSKVQEQVMGEEEAKKNAVKEKMANARRGRKRKYPNIPRELKCTKCGKDVKVVPGQVVKKLEKLDLTIEKYQENYECTTCCPPKRGKPSNPRYANLPKEMTCKCGNKTVVNPYYLDKKAEKEGTTIEKLIKNYKCQTCHPTKGRKKSKKKGKKK